MVLFYLGRYAEALEKINVDIHSFETKFEESATDERIWRAAALICQARVEGVPAEGIAAIVAGLPELEFKESELRRIVYDVSQEVLVIPQERYPY